MKMSGYTPLSLKIFQFSLPLIFVWPHRCLHDFTQRNFKIKVICNFLQFCENFQQSIQTLSGGNSSCDAQILSANVFWRTERFSKGRMLQDSQNGRGGGKGQVAFSTYVVQTSLTFIRAIIICSEEGPAILTAPDAFASKLFIVTSKLCVNLGEFVHIFLQLRIFVLLLSIDS